MLPFGKYFGKRSERPEIATSRGASLLCHRQVTRSPRWAPPPGPGPRAVPQRRSHGRRVPATVSESCRVLPGAGGSLGRAYYLPVAAYMPGTDRLNLPCRVLRPIGEEWYEDLGYWRGWSELSLVEAKNSQSTRAGWARGLGGRLPGPPALPGHRMRMPLPEGACSPLLICHIPRHDVCHAPTAFP